MRILLVNNSGVRKGGADVVFFNTAELLQRYGHRVSFFALSSENNIPNDFSGYFPKGTDYRSLSFVGKVKSLKDFFYNKEAARNLAQLIQKEKPDVAHIHLFFGGLTVSVLEILKKYNIPVVHSVHDYRLVCPAYTFLDRNNRCALKRCSLEGRFSHSIMLSLDAYYRKYFNNPVNLVDHFIFVSQFSKQKHLQYNNQFESKSGVLYNFRPSNFVQHNFRGDYILFYGRLSREKGLETLIKSATNLKFKLKIAGTGPMLQQLQNSQNENFEVLGFKKGKELWDLIQNASYIVVPSEGYENNPLTIVEAFSFGKPVIGSNIGGITELLKNNRGFLFEPKNVESLNQNIKIAMSLSDKEYQQMSQNVFKFASLNFSEEQHYKSLMSIYHSVLNG